VNNDALKLPATSRTIGSLKIVGQFNCHCEKVMQMCSPLAGVQQASWSAPLGGIGPIPKEAKAMKLIRYAAALRSIGTATL
jgi:hypothetical protein